MLITEPKAPNNFGVFIYGINQGLIKIDSAP